jgi:hypothetical protein
MEDMLTTRLGLVRHWKGREQREVKGTAGFFLLHPFYFDNSSFSVDLSFVINDSYKYRSCV